MKNKRKNILLIAGMLLALLVGILAYSAYTQKQIYQESTANLLSTYGQSAKTFTMFAQRNWNILNDWDSYLGTLAELGEQEGQWQEYIAQKATWQYTDFYLFNEQCEFWTTAGRQGTAEYMKATFEKLYTENKPVISSYISSQGIRKILFAIPMEQPLQLDGTTYTALVVSYDNAVLEKLLGSMVYEGQSDCYIVRSNGDVVLSTETKTEITEQMTNLFDYLQQNASVDQPYFDTMVQTLPQGGEGCVLYTLNRQKYYAARDKSAFFMMTVVPMAWKENRLTRVMMIVQDMGKQHLLQSLANTDGLTGLLNKRYFDRVLTVLEQHSQPFALFYMDLDRFKPVNDTYGHDVGDKLLKGVAQRLQGCIRSRDYAFRLGGDEFALLLLGPMTQETCARKMDMICEMIAVPYEIDGNAVSVGASCGYALYPAESVDVQQVRCIADQRMYENKQANHARQDGAEGI